MAKLAYKIDNEYKGIVTYDDKKYTDEELKKMRQEFISLEKSLSKKCKKSYDSEYCYELGLILSNKLAEYKIIESTRYNFWSMLRQNVNEYDKRVVLQTKQRDPYEDCYLLSKLPRELALKYSMSKWDHLFDITTARSDDRIYKWLLDNECDEFVKSNDVFQNFCKCLKLYISDIDTSILSDDELYNIYDDAMNKSILLVKYIHSKKIKMDSKNRDYYFLKIKKINHKNINDIDNVLESLNK